MNEYFSPSELLINPDGSIYHLHLKPEHLADKVMLVGDPDRVNLVATHLTDIECNVHNREFHTITGKYKGKRITVQGTGVRVGTCGGLQPNTPTGTFIASVKSIGFDGLLNFYGKRDEACDLKMEQAFIRHMDWKRPTCIPYIVASDEELLNSIAQDDMVRGYTVACGGFFGPQGRQLRIPLADPKQNEKIESFEYEGLHITNFEMESSAVAGLSRMMGHKALTCCMVIANRRAGTADAGQHSSIDNLIIKVLERI